ncbi:hypothetical protein GCK32_022785 [Trichostrongylus colubriformis]|uniref:Uncharacterized protein n=1 Tax=Trichostrongylus colubriformis TaxID=6319 RepID=A0AAN8GER1_TRICO
MSQAPAPFSLKSAKQQLTRQINELHELIRNGETFKETWKYPTHSNELLKYILLNRSKVTYIKDALILKEQAIQISYTNISNAIDNIRRDDPQQAEELELKFDTYWTERKGDAVLDTSSSLRHNLAVRTGAELSGKRYQVRHSEPQSNIQCRP